MKRLFVIPLLILLTVLGVSAGGRAENEPEELSGTVTLLTNEGGEPYAVLSDVDGLWEYRLNIPPDELEALELVDGQTITVSGYVVGGDDRKKVVPTVVTIEEESFVIREPEAGLTLRQRIQLRNGGEEVLQTREENQIRTERPEDKMQTEEQTRSSRE